MTVDIRDGRGLLALLLALGVGTGVGCSAEDSPPEPQDSDGAESGSTADDSGSEGTLASADSTSGGGESTGADSTGADMDDPNLDRSAPNILDDPSLCGYPGPGPNGYGGLIGQNRFPNFVLEDCSGNQREFAEFFCRREDEYEDFNRAFIVVFEAVW